MILNGATRPHELGHAMGLAHIPGTIMAKDTFQGQYAEGTKHGDKPFENSQLMLVFSQVNFDRLDFSSHLTKKLWIIND